MNRRDFLFLPAVLPAIVLAKGLPRARPPASPSLVALREEVSRNEAEMEAAAIEMERLIDAEFGAGKTR